MKKAKRVSTNQRLRAERSRLKRDIAALEKELVDAGITRNVSLTLRGVHTDVDSIKHMMRGLFWQMAALTKHFNLQPPETPQPKAYSDVDAENIIGGSWREEE